MDFNLFQISPLHFWENNCHEKRNLVLSKVLTQVEMHCERKNVVHLPDSIEAIPVEQHYEVCD